MKTKEEVAPNPVSVKENYQLTYLEDRIVEFNKVESGYQPRIWNNFSNLDNLKDFLSKEGIELFSDSKVSVVTQKNGNKMVQIVLVPNYATELKEEFFESFKDTQDFISKQSLKPTYSIAPDEYKAQVNNFFEGKECFFKDAKALFLKFQEEAEEVKDSASEYELKTRYQNKIIDILFENQEQYS